VIDIQGPPRRYHLEIYSFSASFNIRQHSLLSVYGFASVLNISRGVA